MQDSDYSHIMTADFPPPASSPTASCAPTVEGTADAEIKVPFADSEGPSKCHNNNNNNHNNNNNSYIALYHLKYKLAALYIINIKIDMTIKKAQLLSMHASIST